ncbi:hypothetical protein [Streptomyces paromomycinus]|uniref:Neamine phosphoribosyltransferase n=1 Tax=Streptomyces paromomycinus TaxID=92743 RepID=A0A401VUE6_STREY|nr:hypothetical protein [Streptomyces paromomycinus]GCD40683.1 neamine phosphoribosyltransferase [Streptomyces paromomycinus]
METANARTVEVFSGESPGAFAGRPDVRADGVAAPAAEAPAAAAPATAAPATAAPAGPPPLRRAAVASAVRLGSAEARYACACSIEQLLADTAACPTAPESARALLDEVRQACQDLARAVAAGPGGQFAPPAPGPGFLERAMARTAAYTAGLWRTGAARGDTAAEALLRHATDWKTPECYAYDLADVGLVHGQAAAWLAATEEPVPVFVVGIRTGGSYLAPLWAAAVAAAGRTAAPWTSLRPLRTGGRISLVPAETGRLPATLPPGTVVVAVDDQPDTGGTARAVRDALARRYPEARDVVCASPGRTYAVDGAGIRPLTRTSAVREDAGRLWQLLAPADADRLTDRARSGGAVPADATVYRVTPFRGPFLAAYGPRATATDAPGAGTSPAGPADSAGTRPAGPADATSTPPATGALRISPRNTPFSLVADEPATGIPGAPDARPRAYHFRFIGTGPHGAQGAEAVEALGEFLPPVRHHLDGYLVTGHEDGLRPLATELPRMTGRHRRQALEAVARYWHALDHLGGLGPVDPTVTYAPRERLATALERLRDRLARPLPVDGAWLDRHLPRRAAFGGTRARVFRTSLPYSHQSWHWQVGAPPAPGAPPVVRRFGLDWIWGGTGPLEAEISSFVVEHRLDPADLATLRTAVGDDRAFDAALELAGDALWWNVKSWLRRCPAPAPDTARRIADDLGELARYVTGLR